MPDHGSAAPVPAPAPQPAPAAEPQETSEPLPIAGARAAGARRDPAALLAAAVGGDQLAWGRLVNGLEHVPRAVARSFRLTDADADDVVQSTWLALLPERHRRLMSLVADESAPDYRQISATLAIPVGSIGPIRARSLARLGRHPELRRLCAAAPTGAVAPSCGQLS